MTLSGTSKDLEGRIASSENEKPPEAILINEAQLILAEKRTSLALMRTGIAVFAIPLSVLSFLVVTSKYYEFGKVLHFLLPLLIICAGLIILGGFLVVRSFIRMRQHERHMLALKKKHSVLAELID
ncbi:MAG: DUF202 domain-containing protein [Proteobacteria bacterium]|nr:DUF202 domain-containing protein [Pseudomonadota bacterium]